MRVGVEVGGTFTDLVAIGPAGVTVTKVPSVPRAPDEGAFNALVESGIDLSRIRDLTHGSTVATNAVLERKGYPTALVTTAGFRDILALQRHNRTSIYNLAYQKPKPVVERKDTFEIAERILADGSVLTALSKEEVVTKLVPHLKSGNYQAVAICLLNAYVNPEHEQALRGILHTELPGVHVAISSDVTREFREYERSSTTVLSAYVQPVIDSYIERFAARLERSGFKGRFSVMQSNGGRLPASAIGANAVSALLSGPAAGVMGAARQAGRSGCKNLITLDMGGTSTDVCVVTEGRPDLTSEFHIDGLPIRTPLLDINTIGAGGGSIVWMDEGGMLRVGPRSAGADPGPACYGRGGTEPTITDAHLIRGTIRSDALLGGRMKMDGDAARGAFRDISAALEMSVEEAADSAIQLANANITRAIQLISTERGKDPRDYVLVPFGGAGPLHAARVAQELGVTRIVVPPTPGVLSAYGLIASDFVQFESQTKRAFLDETSGTLVREVVAQMKRRALERFASMGLADKATVKLIAEMRFTGQAFEVPVEFSENEIATLTPEFIRQRFQEAHQRVYFFGAESSKPVEFVSFRLGMTSPVGDVPRLERTRDEHASQASVKVFENRQWSDTRTLGRDAVSHLGDIEGPAIIDDTTSTLFVPAGWVATADPEDNLILTRVDRDE